MRSKKKKKKEGSRPGLSRKKSIFLEEEINKTTTKWRTCIICELKHATHSQYKWEKRV